MGIRKTEIKRLPILKSKETLLQVLTILYDGLQDPPKQNSYGGLPTGGLLLCQNTKYRVTYLTYSHYSYHKVVDHQLQRKSTLLANYANEIKQNNHKNKCIADPTAFGYSTTMGVNTIKMLGDASL